jgi:hypothetical protein
MRQLLAAVAVALALAAAAAATPPEALLALARRGHAAGVAAVLSARPPPDPLRALEHALHGRHESLLPAAARDCDRDPDCTTALPGDHEGVARALLEAWDRGGGGEAALLPALYLAAQLRNLPVLRMLVARIPPSARAAQLAVLDAHNSSILMAIAQCGRAHPGVPPSASSLMWIRCFNARADPKRPGSRGFLRGRTPRGSGGTLPFRRISSWLA